MLPIFIRFSNITLAFLQQNTVLILDNGIFLASFYNKICEIDMNCLAFAYCSITQTIIYFTKIKAL